MKPFLLSLIITACVAIGVLLWLNPEIRDRITDNWTDRSSPQPDDVKTEEAVPEQREIPPPVRWTGPVGEWTFPGDDALVPFRSSWIYPQILNWRPADGLVSELNPPRFSWPYLQEIVAPGRNQIPRNYFSFQIADNPEFEAPVLDVENTPYNFYNAVPALAPGEWFWRVGYGLTPEVSWSETKSFTVSPEAKVWDRTVIHDAAKILAQRARPRSGPADGDWAALNNRLQNDPRTADQYRGIMTVADRALTLPWWDNMPESDARPPEGFTTRNQREGTIRMLKNAVMVAYAYRLTGDERYSGAMSRILKMASWPRGGGLSPELLGGETKMPSQAAELFAVAYDWFAKDLRPAEARVLREAVAWRLRDMYLDPGSIIWHYGEDGMRDYGLSYFAGSHPYQNFVWTVPATLLMAGDLDIADQLLPLTLHYLTGVTLPDGPEEGYNEGHGYSNEKGGTLLFAALVTDMLLPELEIGKNPVIENFGNWLVYLFPGVERLPWGDSFMSSTRGIGGDNLRMVTYLTGSPLANAIWRQRGFDVAVRNVGTLFSRPWFEMAAYVHYEDRVAAIPEAEKERTLFLPEAGWVFTQSQPIFNHSDFRQSIGMQFQMRPRGGYGHSFASDGSFIWYAHGELLSSGGGWTHWASFHHARSPISHNTLLIDGKGHSSVNPYSPAVPYVARPLAFQETESHTYWAADLTPGYAPVAEVERVHRHVLFLNRRWFVIFDDIALKPGADPAIFSWLFHVYQEVPVSIVETNAPGWDYTIAGVNARVRFGNDPRSVSILNLEGYEGHHNPLTGEDLYTPDMERAASRAIFRPFLDAKPMANNLWVNTVEPAREHRFLSVLAAEPHGYPMPRIDFVDTRAVVISEADGSAAITVTFDPAIPGDIFIDVEAVRRHAQD